MPADKHLPHMFLVLFQILDLPIARINGRLYVHVHGPRLRVKSAARINFRWNLEIKRDDGRFQAGCEMKCSFIEMADFSGGDPAAFRAEVSGFSCPEQSALGPL